MNKIIKQKKKIGQLAKKYGLDMVMLFGSFAAGKNREGSDIDIAVRSKKNLSLNKELSFIADINKIIPGRIDLSVVNHANPLHLYEISKNAILLYGEKNDFIKFKLYAFHRYNDYTPYFKLEEKINRAVIKQYAYK